MTGGRSELSQRVLEMATRYGVAEKSIRLLGIERLLEMDEESRALLINMVVQHRNRLMDGKPEPTSAQKRSRWKRGAA